MRDGLLEYDLLSQASSGIRQSTEHADLLKICRQTACGRLGLTGAPVHLVDEANARRCCSRNELIAEVICRCSASADGASECMRIRGDGANTPGQVAVLEGRGMLRQTHVCV